MSYTENDWDKKWFIILKKNIKLDLRQFSHTVTSRECQRHRLGRFLIDLIKDTDLYAHRLHQAWKLLESENKILFNGHSVSMMQIGKCQRPEMDWFVGHFWWFCHLRWIWQHERYQATMLCIHIYHGLQYKGKKKKNLDGEVRSGSQTAPHSAVNQINFQMGNNKILVASIDIFFPHGIYGECIRR